MHYIIGIDEAGRGPWAGPIVVGGFMCPIDFDFTIFSPILDDSKKISENNREEVYNRIERVMERNICRYHFAYRDATEIDTLGIREANRVCMEEVILGLLQFIHKNDSVSIYIDGCDNYTFSACDFRYNFAEKNKKTKAGVTKKVKPGAIHIPGKNNQNNSEDQNIYYIINGDALIPVISAASVIAKVTRDRMMCDFHEDFPNYGFDQHKGYGTTKHRNAIIHYGITPIHRKTYDPIKSLILKSSSV